MTNKFTEEKLREFDEEFGGNTYLTESALGGLDLKQKLKDFLSQTIEEARKAEREEIKEMIREIVLENGKEVPPQEIITHDGLGMKIINSLNK